MKLSNKQKQFLKGLAHPLKPVVQLGGNGLTEGVLAEIDNALNHHELIKVKVPSDDREEKADGSPANVRLCAVCSRGRRAVSGGQWLPARRMPDAALGCR